MGTYDGQTGMLYIGTKQNQIIKISTLRDRSELLVDGHIHKVNCVGVHPTNDIYVTGADDGHLKSWDSEGNKPCNEGTFVFKDTKIKSLAWSPDGKVLACGLVNSTVCVFTYNRNQPLKVACRLQIPTNSNATEIRSLKFEANGHLAAGHSDGMIYMYTMSY